MTTLENCSEENYTNVYWKIKNFSFCFKEIKSPEFSLSGFKGRLYLKTTFSGTNCSVYFSTLKTRIISFLTCDGSPELSTLNGIRPLEVPNDVIFGKRRSSFLPEDTLTVQLRFRTKKKLNIFIPSEIGVKRKCFLWEIHKCISYNPENSENYALTITIPYGDIKLAFKSKGGINTDEQFFLEISRSGGDRCYFFLKVSILNVDGTAVNEVSEESIFEREGDQKINICPVFFKKSKLLEFKNLLLPNDTLSLKCNFAISLGSLAEQSVNCCDDVEALVKERLSMSFKDKNDNSTVAELQTDLKSLLDDGTLFDANLKIGDEIIKVHKAILSARSPVFRAMFTKDMKEKIDGHVVIEDLNVETVRRLLLYIYTDYIHYDHWENMKKLYFAADKYELLGLKNKCISFLISNLSVSNVCETFILADLYQNDDLKTAALDFISENNSAFFSSEEWKEFETKNITLAIEIMRKFCCSNRISLN